MTALIDNKLKLVYKNMVGLSNIITDTSGDSYFISSVSVNSNLFVCGFTILNNTTNINSNLIISGQSLFNGPVTINSLLNISGISILNGPTTINESLNISGSTYINNNLIINGNSNYNGPATYCSQLNVSGTATFQNGIITNNINGSSININASTINIGNPNSLIFINGTTSYVASTETLVMDKVISLNINSSTLQGADIGAYSGIEIMGISGYGFIATNGDASRFQIQTPLYGAPTNYITVQDINNNLIISGSTILIGNTTLNSNLYVSGASIFNGSTTMNNSLFVSGSSVISGYCSINNSLFISSTTLIGGACSINSLLNVSGFTTINNKVSINSTLNVSGITNINGQITIFSNLNISGTTNINNATSINSYLNISGITTINGSISTNSFLNVSGSSNIMGNETINAKLYVSNITILNSSTTINSSLVVSGASVFYNSVSVNSNLGVLGQMVALLPNYLDNTSAKIGGIPIWGWYRTGGIIKIRLNDTPPTIYLSGASTINIYQGNTYNDPGAYSIDYTDGTDPVYLSLVTGTTSIISNVLVSGTSTLFTQTSLLPIGNYTATYTATDSLGLIGLNYRLLNIISKIFILNYSSTYVYLLNNVAFNSNGLQQQFISSWGIQPSYLSSIGFNYNGTWSIVFKGTLLNYGPGNYSEIHFDIPSNNLFLGGLLVKNLNGNNNNSANNGFDSNFTSLSVNNTYYFVISRVNSYINIKIYNNGSLLENSFSLATYNFINPYLFSVYMENNYQFYSGILLNPTSSNLTYQDFINYFGA